MASDRFWEQMNGSLTAIRDLVGRMSHEEITFSGGAALIGHRPAVGPEAYALALFQPLEPSQLADYEVAQKIAIPSPYKAILGSLNGAHLFELSLFGIPPSMISSKPVLDRTNRQPLDLATANHFWRIGYAAPPEWFHFGSSALSFDESVGYFLEPSGGVSAMRKDQSVWNSWISLSEFFSSELRRVEQMYPAFEAFMADFRH